MNNLWSVHDENEIFEIIQKNKNKMITLVFSSDNSQILPQNINISIKKFIKRNLAPKNLNEIFIFVNLSKYGASQENYFAKSINRQNLPYVQFLIHTNDTKRLCIIEKADVNSIQISHDTVNSKIKDIIKLKSKQCEEKNKFDISSIDSQKNTKESKDVNENDEKNSNCDIKNKNINENENENDNENENINVNKNGNKNENDNDNNNGNDNNNENYNDNENKNDDEKNNISNEKENHDNNKKKEDDLKNDIPDNDNKEPVLTDEEKAQKLIEEQLANQQKLDELEKLKKKLCINELKKIKKLKEKEEGKK